MLKSILDHAVMGIVFTDNHLTITEVGTAILRMFGYTRDECVGKKVYDLFLPPEAVEKAKRALSDHHENGERRYLGKKVHELARHKDGHTFPIEIYVSASEIGFQAFVLPAEIAGKTRIMVVEKTVESSDRILHLLQSNGYEVVVAQDLPSALQAVIHEFSPDILLLDMASMVVPGGEPGGVPAAVAPVAVAVATAAAEAAKVAITAAQAAEAAAEVAVAAAKAAQVAKTAAEIAAASIMKLIGEKKD